MNVDLELLTMTGSAGTCQGCGASNNRKGCRAHVDDCFAGTSQRLMVEVVDPHAREYWLLLDLSVTATLDSLDSFIRRIWVDCCDHLSWFSIGGKDYNYYPRPGERSMNVPADAVLKPGARARYTYDAGSSTVLEIRTSRRPASHRPRFGFWLETTSRPLSAIAAPPPASTYLP